MAKILHFHTSAQFFLKCAARAQIPNLIEELSHTMKSRISTFAVATLGAAGLVLSAAPTASAVIDKDRVPSFQEFRDATFQDRDGQYVVNGDEAIADQQGLRDYYEQMISSKDTNHAELVVNTVGGRDDVWSASQVRNLTYCVSNDFGANKSAIVNATAAGAANWENAEPAVNFVYVPSADSNCTTSNSSVLFSVEPTYTNQYIARAFFPSSPSYQRNVLVNASSLLNSGSWTPANIMGHELGHTLGFRHEHTRPESGKCFEDNNWRPLTPYDSASMMHYPQCGGTSSNLGFTASDAAGVRAIY